jgi:hypothetical protein
MDGIKAGQAMTRPARKSRQAQHERQRKARERLEDAALEYQKYTDFTARVRLRRAALAYARSVR